MTLRQFVEGKTQQVVADALGVGQSAIAQMLASDRDIRIVVNPDGSVADSYELKPLGKRSAGGAA